MNILNAILGWTVQHSFVRIYLHIEKIASNMLLYSETKLGKPHFANAFSDSYVWKKYQKTTVGNVYVISVIYVISPHKAFPPGEWLLWPKASENINIIQLKKYEIYFNILIQPCLSKFWNRCPLYFRINERHHINSWQIIPFIIIFDRFDMYNYSRIMINVTLIELH